MKVCSHRGLTMVVYTRDEHCPPHVHVGEADWDARFRFSFWHNGVALWDVAPSLRAPKATLLEELRQRLKSPETLRRARRLWWQSRSTTCLDNQRWDVDEHCVRVAKASRGRDARVVASIYDPEKNITVLQLERHGRVEIEL